MGVSLTDALGRIEARKASLMRDEPILVGSLEDAYALLASDLELGRGELTHVCEGIARAYMGSLQAEYPTGQRVPDGAVAFFMAQATANGCMVGAMFERM